MKMKETRMKANAGFSLIEIIAVIAVMAILALLAVPMYGNYTKKAALAADSSYISECYRAGAVVAADISKAPLLAISVKPDGTVAICHEIENAADEFIADTTAAGYVAADPDTWTMVKDPTWKPKYVFCDDCNEEIAEIIGGMQELQSGLLGEDGKPNQKVISGTSKDGKITYEGLDLVWETHELEESGDDFSGWVYYAPVGAVAEAD